MALNTEQLRQTGLVDMEAVWRGKPFTGSGQRKADTFETEGVNIQAREL